MKKIITLILAVSCLSSGLAYAGRESGGGDSIANPRGGRSLLDTMESDDVAYISMRMVSYHPELRDVYNAFYQWDGKAASPRFAFWGHLSACADENEIIDTTLISKAWNTKPLLWAFTNQDLEEINDEGVIRIENPTTKKQLAIQRDGLVLVNKIEFYQLDDISKAALKLHEAAICATQKLNPRLIQKHGTSKIRAFVRAIVNYMGTRQNEEKEPLSEDAVIAAIDALSLPNPSPNNPYSKEEAQICSIKSDVYDIFRPQGCVHAIVSEDGEILSSCFSDSNLRGGLVHRTLKKLIEKKICSPISQ